MKVVILCGGKGTRYNADKPKSLAMIGDKPIIHHLMDIYSAQGHNDFILTLGWRQEDIVNYFTKKIEHTFNITYVDTGQNSNTAKRLKLIQNYATKDWDEKGDLYTNENFFCTYADGLSNINLTKLYMRHITHKNVSTLTAIQPVNQFGELKFDSVGNVIEFKEKPRMKEYINGGFFIFNKKIFDYIDINKNQELEKDILAKLAENNQLGSYKHDDKDSFWITLNTAKDEIMINELYRKRELYNEIMDWLRI